MVRVFFGLLVSSALAAAQSHPSWWTLASPESTALVGIQWESVRSSPFADAVAAELSSLGVPDLACLRDARQILISSPSLLAIAIGDFSTSLLREQAAAKHLRSSAYRGIALWTAPEKGGLGIARLNDTMLLIGERKTLEAAIDRTMEAGKNYSPLLETAARYAQDDLWVVSTQLPDPLASLFVPLDSNARGFEGGVSLRDGLRLDATLDAGSEEAAAFAADALIKSIPSLPSVARGLQVTPDADHVELSLDVSPEQLAAGLRTSPAEPAPATPAPAAPAEPAPPTGPQIIHIYGLDGGPREIILPPVKPQEHK